MAAGRQQIGDAFRRRVALFAEASHIPVVVLRAADRNIEVMQPYLEAAAATGRSQVAAVRGGPGGAAGADRPPAAHRPGQVPAVLL